MDHTTSARCRASTASGPVDWVAGQAIRVMIVTAVALLCGAAATRITYPARSKLRA